MAILPIAKLGNPILRQIAAKVDPRDIRTNELQRFIDNLFETMLDEPGIGLAAPQVSRSIQLVVMGCEGEDGFPKPSSSIPRSSSMVRSRLKIGKAVLASMGCGERSRGPQS